MENKYLVHINPPLSTSAPETPSNLNYSLIKETLKWLIVAFTPVQFCLFNPTSITHTATYSPKQMHSP